MRSPSALASLALLAALASSLPATAAMQSASVAPQSGPVAERLARLFLPRFECTKRPVVEWLDRLQQSTGREAHDALWCAYWTNDRSPEVIEGLRSILAKAVPSLAREIDVVLTEWDVPHDSPAPCWISEASGGPATPDQLDASFAQECGWRAEDLAAVFHEREWSTRDGKPSYLARRGLFAVPLRAVDLPDPDLVRALDSTDRVAQAEAAVTLALRRQSVTQALRALLARDATDPEALRTPREAKWRSLSVAADPARHPVTWFDVGYGVGGGWMRLGCALQAWPSEQTTQMALSWIRAYAGTAAFVGTGLGPVPAPFHVQPELRSEYETHELPEVADPTTLSPARRTQRLVQQLETRLARHESPEPVLAELMGIVEPPYLKNEAVGPVDHYFGFLDWLETHDFADARITDWCLSIVASEFPCTSHLRSATSYLSRQELNPRQQAILCRFQEWQVQSSRRNQPRFEASLFARQGGAAIEVAGYLRHEAQLRQDLELLDTVLAIAKPSPRDHEMLLAALARGVATERLRAVQIVEARKLDTPRLRAAVRGATSDLDHFVRAAATALAAARGW